MKKLIPSFRILFQTTLILCIIILYNCSEKTYNTNNINKPRLIVTTDIGGDPDDQQSMVRLMLYTNEFDIEGIIATASGTPGELDTQVVRPDLVKEIINAYGVVQPNLVLHDEEYSPVNALLSKIKAGNPHRVWENIGKDKDTEGSEWIIKTVDASNLLTNISIWGGQTDLAQALFNVKNTRSEKEYDRFISKLRIYDIGDQDHIYDSIISNHPDLFYILAKAPEGEDKRNAAFRGMYLGGDMELTSLNWLQNNVLKNHGPLGSLYPTKTWTAPNPHGCMKEGDTPSWFYFLNNGLNFPENPYFGGWGGRFNNIGKNLFVDANDCIDSVCDARTTVWRWRSHYQNDFKARMDWCILPFEKANHAPVIVINGDKSKKPLLISQDQELTILLDASKSVDPDGNTLSFKWYLYEDLSDNNSILISNPNSEKTEISSKEKGRTHIILEVCDNGDPSLISYKRVIVNSL